MTRRTITSLALGLIVISALFSTANAQTLSYVADTGVIDLAPGQTLRVSASGSGSGAATVQFKKMEYVESHVTDGIVLKQVGSQTTSGPAVLSGDECLVFFIGGSGAGVRLKLYSSSPNLTAKAFVVSPASGSGGPMVEEISLTYQKIELSR